MSDASPSPVSAKPKRKPRASHQSIVLANARKATKGVKVGRPLTYHPDLCERAVALGKQGKHWAAIASAFNVSRATLYKWEAEFPEFGDALARARAESQAWWERKVQSKLGAKHFQAQGAKLIMAGQFEDYREANKAGNSNGLDLNALVGAIAQGVASGMLPPGQAGDDAKVIEAEPVKDDASPAHKG